MKTHSDNDTLKRRHFGHILYIHIMMAPTCGVLGGCAVQPRGQEAGAGRVEAGGGAGGPVHLQ